MFLINGRTRSYDSEYVRIDEIYQDMPVGMDMLQRPIIMVRIDGKYDAHKIAETICMALNKND